MSVGSGGAGSGGVGLARCAGGLVVVLAAGLVMAGCGVVHVSAGGGPASASAQSSSAVYRADLAYAHCMQTHGMPSFPDPKPGGSYSVNGSPRGPVNSPVVKANAACKYLLPGSGGSGGGQVSGPQLAAALTISQCIRAHGVPSFPDPTVVNGAVNFDYTGVNSPQFQAAVKACQSVIPKGVHLP